MTQLFTIFTIVTGILTILSFVMQIAGFFPNYRKYFLPAFYLFLGLTIGLISNIANQSTVVIPIALTAREIAGFVMYFVSAGMTIFSMLVMIFSENSTRRDSASVAAFCSGTFFVCALIFGHAFFFAADNTSDSRYVIDIQELTILAENAREYKDYDRAIELYTFAQQQQERNLRKNGESTIFNSPGGKLLQYYRDQINDIRTERIPESK